MSSIVGESPHVRATLTVTVDDLTPEQRQRLAEEVEKAVQRVLNPDEEEVVGGWTSGTLHAALDRLEGSGAWVQAQCIREALKHQGYVTRERVYKIGKYPADRMLRGFTRPTNGVVKKMKAAGELPEDAVPLLSPSYQDGVSADGFHVHSALARLL